MQEFEFRSLEKEVSKKEEFYHNEMQEFATQAEGELDAQKRSLIEEGRQELNQYELSTFFFGKEPREYVVVSDLAVIHFKLRLRGWVTTRTVRRCCSETTGTKAVPGKWHFWKETWSELGLKWKVVNQIKNILLSKGGCRSDIAETGKHITSPYQARQVGGDLRDGEEDLRAARHPRGRINCSGQLG